MALSLTPYNNHFPTEAEARLAHRVWSLALYGWKGAKLPFPGDRPHIRRSRHGNGLFESLHQVDLADYASRFTTLRPAGPGKWRGLCPLHDERTASFYVYTDPWRWRCYGACAIGGDIVALARERKKRGHVYER